jgi:hypothetical protein
VDVGCYRWDDPDFNNGNASMSKCYKLSSVGIAVHYNLCNIYYIVSAIGMGVSTSYSNKESALQFEETLRLLDDIGSKFKENKK